MLLLFTKCIFMLLRKQTYIFIEICGYLGWPEEKI